MTFVPRDASDEQVLDIVREWVDVLSQEDYEAAFAAVGYTIAGENAKATFIQSDIKGYRSPKYYPEVEDFVVTDWRTAQGGNPEPVQSVTWYKPNSINMAGAVSFDLPLNGSWSDLTAEFVFFDNNHAEGHSLFLEEIESYEQSQRDIEGWEQQHPEADAFGPESAVT